MAELQQAVNQVTGDLAQLKDHFDKASAATTSAMAEQGQKMTLQDSDLRKLHDLANEAIAAVNVKLNGMAAAAKESKEHKWRLTRPKDMLPTMFIDEKEWRKWKEGGRLRRSLHTRDERNPKDGGKRERRNRSQVVHKERNVRNLGRKAISV